MNTAKIVVTHTPKTASGGLLSNIFSNETALIALFLFIVIPLIVKIIVSRRLSRERVKLFVYNPETRKWWIRDGYQIVPGIYSTYDADVIAFIPVNAPTDRVEIGRTVYDVYPVIKSGGAYIYSELPASLALYFANEGLEVKPRSITELILELYNRKELKPTFNIRPDMKVALYIDSRKLAESIAEVYDRLAEESVVSIAQLTGKRKEYEAWVKSIIEMTLQKHAGIAKILLIVGIVMFILMVAASMIH